MLDRFSFFGILLIFRLVTEYGLPQSDHFRHSSFVQSQFDVIKKTSIFLARRLLLWTVQCFIMPCPFMTGLHSATKHVISAVERPIILLAVLDN
jgi:hypothetical protein